PDNHLVGKVVVTDVAEVAIKRIEVERAQVTPAHCPPPFCCAAPSLRSPPSASQHPAHSGTPSLSWCSTGPHSERSLSQRSSPASPTSSSGPSPKRWHRSVACVLPTARTYPTCARRDAGRPMRPAFATALRVTCSGATA